MGASSRNSFRQGFAREDGEQQSAGKNAGELAWLIRQSEANLEHCQDKHTKQRSVDGAGAAEDRGAAQNDRGDGEEFVTDSRICLRLANAREINQSGQGGDNSRERVGQREPLLEGDAGIARAFRGEPDRTK